MTALVCIDLKTGTANRYVRVPPVTERVQSPHGWRTVVKKPASVKLTHVVPNLVFPVYGDAEVALAQAIHDFVPYGATSYAVA
jgi:hypothetical protein